MVLIDTGIVLGFVLIGSLLGGPIGAIVGVAVSCGVVVVRRSGEKIATELNIKPDEVTRREALHMLRVSKDKKLLDAMESAFNDTFKICPECGDVVLIEDSECGRCGDNVKLGPLSVDNEVFNKRESQSKISAEKLLVFPGGMVESKSGPPEGYISKSAYSVKYKVPMQKINAAAGLRDIPSCWYDGAMWIKDERF